MSGSRILRFDGLRGRGLRSDRASSMAWFAGCALLCIALRLPFIDVPLGTDEGGNAFIATSWSSTHGSLYGAYWVDRSPLLLLAYRGALSVGGVLGVRMLGMVAAVMLIVAAMGIARQVADQRAARVAGLLTAILTSSVLMGAVFTGAELLAAVPSAFSVWCLLLAHRSRHVVPWLVGAGMLASTALLLKQSFGDAFVAGAIFVAASILRTRRPSVMAYRALAYLSGVVLPLLAVYAWVTAWSVGPGPLTYALFGFRVDSIAIMEHDGSATRALLHTGIPVAMASGCLVLLPWAIAHLWHVRNHRIVTLTLAAWLGAGILGIVGGGAYSPHYFVELIAVLSVLGGCALAASRRKPMVAAAAALLGILSVANVGAGTVLEHRSPPQQRTLAVSSYLRAHGRPGDTLYVMYARANIMYYAGMPGTYPYAWSLMVRTLPRAEARLRSMLASPKRPTWIVEWQQPTAWNLDRSGATRRLLASEYRTAATVCGKPVLVRRDRPAETTPHAKLATCSSLDVPEKVVTFVDESGTVADSADYIWQ